MNLKTPKTITLDKGSPAEKKENIRKYFHLTYDIDEHLYETLKDDKTFYMRADPLRHPLIFYYGHTAAFFINKLIISKIITERINPEFESMFAIGVDEMSWDDLNEEHYDWPSVEEVKAYRDKVRRVVDQVIADLPMNLPIDWNDPFWIIMMCIEHERIHLETSSVLIRQLPIEQVKADVFGKICKESNQAPQNQLIAVKGGQLTLGKPYDHNLYGWDNEYGKMDFEIADFKAAKYLVSNYEFKQFVDNDGYLTKKWWTEEGWKWRTYKKAEHPLFWIRQKNKWKFRTMAKIIEMPWDWPVEVNYLEAKAFCNWLSEQTGAKLRMPTEEEWYHLRNKFDIADQPYWDKAPGNINLEYFASSAPVDKFKFGDFYDIIGNVWQWTETPIYAFPGFKVHPVYDDFSTPTFDGKHNLIKGGSWISTGNEATYHGRYAFRRHFFQHAGFRYIKSEAPIITHNNFYESDKDVVEECDAHYGEDKLDVPNYRNKISELAVYFTRNNKKREALELGCSVGRTSFELAKVFQRVIGLDFSARFIKAAISLKEKGNLRYKLKETGEIVSFHEKFLKDFGFDKIRNKVDFIQSDYANLKSNISGYDLIVVNDILDKMYAPKELLKNLKNRINQNGILIIASGFDWNYNLTKRENWLGGFRQDGELVSNIEALNEILEKDFLKVDSFDHIPQILRKNARKYIFKLMYVSIWKYN